MREQRDLVSSLESELESIKEKLSVPPPSISEEVRSRLGPEASKFSSIMEEMGRKFPPSYQDSLSGTGMFNARPHYVNS